MCSPGDHWTRLPALNRTHQQNPVALSQASAGGVKMEICDKQWRRGKEGAGSSWPCIWGLAQHSDCACKCCQPSRGTWYHPLLLFLPTNRGETQCKGSTSEVMVLVWGWNRKGGAVRRSSGLENHTDVCQAPVNSVVNTDIPHKLTRWKLNKNTQRQTKTHNHTFITALTVTNPPWVLVASGLHAANIKPDYCIPLIHLYWCY